MADLTTIQNVKPWLDQKQATDDALLGRLISGVSAAAEQRADRTFLSAAYTETLNGNGRSVLFLRHTPITAVTSVLVNGVSIPARTTPTGSGFAFDHSTIYLAGQCFTFGVQNVTVSWQGGFTTLPLDLEQAVIEIVAFKYRERSHIGQSSKMLGQETINYFRDVPVDALRVIDGYKRVVTRG